MSLVYSTISSTKMETFAYCSGMTLQASIFHYGSISLISEPCRSAHLKAMELAKKAGALMSFDPNLRLLLWPSPEEARKQILNIWNQADIAKVSEVELAFLTGHDSVEDEVAMRLWHPNLKLLLVTLGDKGCKYYTKVHCLHCCCQGEHLLIRSTQLLSWSVAILCRIFEG